MTGCPRLPPDRTAEKKHGQKRCVKAADLTVWSGSRSTPTEENVQQVWTVVGVVVKPEALKIIRFHAKCAFGKITLGKRSGDLSSHPESS